MNETNEAWLNRLTATGSVRDDAIAQLRETLWFRLRKAFQGEPRFDDAILDDVVQNALLKVIDSLDQFQGRSQFTTWATTIAIRSAFSELRRRRWQDVSLDQMLDSATSGFEMVVGPALDPAETLYLGDIIEKMYEIIRQKLTGKQRTALLAELAGMPLAEIGRRTGSNRNSVYKLTHDARKRLRTELEAAGFDINDFQTT